MTTNLISLDERVGTRITSLEDAGLHDVLHAAGMDFETETVPMQTFDGDEVPRRKAIRRTDTKEVLGVVGNKYTPVHNDRMLEPFHRMVQKYGAQYENAGVIQNGRKCWISAVLPDTFKLENRPEDEVQRRIMGFFSHDGTRKNSYLSIAHRIFCNNQLNIIMDKAMKSKYTVSHTSNWEDQWVESQLGFETAIALHKEFEHTANKLDQIPMTVNQMRGFTQQVLPVSYYLDKQKDKDKKRRGMEKLQARREQIVDLFSNGAGNIGKSRWDALNAVTEYVDHHNQIKRVEHETRGRVHAETRFVNGLISGTGSNTKQLAVSLLSNTKRFKSVASYA